MQKQPTPGSVLPIEGRDHCLGPSGARYSLIEYVDFEDDGCALAHAEVQLVVKELTDDLCFVVRNFPLTDRHAHAQKAAEAAEAAEMQGHFWLMHDRLLVHTAALDEARIREIARSIPLDMHEFERDLASGGPARRVAEDVEFASQHGVRTVPAFFVNGQPYAGLADFLPLLQAITGEK